ncbi:MAG: transcriptional regulator [Chitinophagales bacterium]
MEKPMIRLSLDTFSITKSLAVSLKNPFVFSNKTNSIQKEMKLKPVKTDKEYQALLEWIDERFDKKIKRNSPQGDQLQIALLLIKQYEDEHYPIPLPDPIEAIKLRMQELGLKNKDLVGKVGSKGHVSAILNRTKPMTIEIARVFHRELGVPADVLLG